jgi:hypothetical protein
LQFTEGSISQVAEKRASRGLHPHPGPETLLWYEYHVDKQRYLASNYRNGGNGTPFSSVAEAAGKRYPVGRTVSVYYNPKTRKLPSSNQVYGGATLLRLRSLYCSWARPGCQKGMPK